MRRCGRFTSFQVLIPDRSGGRRLPPPRDFHPFTLGGLFMLGWGISALPSLSTKLKCGGSFYAWIKEILTG